MHTVTLVLLCLTCYSCSATQQCAESSDENNEVRSPSLLSVTNIQSVKALVAKQKASDAGQVSNDAVEEAEHFKAAEGIRLKAEKGLQAEEDASVQPLPSCGWMWHWGFYSPGFAAGISTQYKGWTDFKLKRECQKLDEACAGITCHDPGLGLGNRICTLRAGKKLGQSPYKGGHHTEATLMKGPNCNPTACFWASHSPYYSAGYAGGVSQKFSYEAAKRECIQLGNETCKAITCSVTKSGIVGPCTLRATAIFAGSTNGEITYRPSASCFTTTTTSTTTSAGPEWHLAPKGATECDYGKIEIEENCEAAVQTLATKYGKSPARKMMVAAKQTFSCNQAWGAVPVGCSAQTGGDWTAHFKSVVSGPSACVQDAYRMVCRSQR